MALARWQSRLLGIRSESRAVSAVTSQRAPAGALQQYNWRVPEGQPLQPKDNGENLIRGGYDLNTYAARCIDRIANDVAALPFRVGDPVSSNFNLRAPIAQLLGPAPGGPNLRWSAHALWRYSIAQYKILGKFAWLKEYAPGTKDVIGLWPLPAQYVLPLVAESGNDYFSKFAVGIRGTVGYFETDPSNLVYVYRPSQSDMRQPESSVAMATMDLNIMALIGQFDYAFLRNGGVPAYVVKTASFPSDDDRIGFREQFDAKYMGPENAGKVMFYEQDLFPGDDGGYPPDPFKIETIGLSQKDSQLADMRKAKIQDVCVAFGVPLSILGDSTISKFANAVADRTNYYMTTISGEVAEIADAVNIELASELGGTVGWFDVTGVPELRKPRVFTDESGMHLVLAKIIHPDELRADAGLPPMKDVGLKPEEVTSPIMARITETGKIGPNGQLVPDPLAGNSAPAVPPGPAPAPAPVAAPKTAPLPIGAGLAGRTDMLEAARIRRDVRAGKEVAIWHTHPEATKSGVCPECAALDGRATTRTVPLHPGCACSLDPPVRHAGAEGHQHVSSGHATKGVIERLLTASVQRLFAEQDRVARERLDGRRFKNQRGVDSVYDAVYWTDRVAEVLAAVQNGDDALARQCVSAVRGELAAEIAEGDINLPSRVGAVLRRAGEKLIADALVGMRDTA